MALIDSVVKFEGDDAGIFMKPATTDPQIADLGFDLMDDVKNRKYIYLNTTPGKITKKKAGCGWSATVENGATVYRKLIQPVPLIVEDEVCAEEFDDTIYSKAKNAGVKADDITGTDIEKALVEMYSPAISKDALRILFLADTALSDANYNQLDGVYKKLKAGVLVDSIIDHGAITDNDLLAYDPANPESNAPAPILQLFEKFYTKSGRRLKSMPKAEKAFVVTETVADAWEAYLSTRPGLQSSKDELINGITNANFYKGIRIIPVGVVDEYLTEDFAAGSPPVVSNPHRIIYTALKNNVVVMDSTNALNEVEFWYERKERSNCMRAQYTMQYEYRYPELVAIGGF